MRPRNCELYDRVFSCSFFYYSVFSHQATPSPIEFRSTLSIMPGKLFFVRNRYTVANTVSISIIIIAFTNLKDRRAAAVFSHQATPSSIEFASTLSIMPGKLLFFSESVHRI
jgi:hypothetical protein